MAKTKYMRPRVMKWVTVTGQDENGNKRVESYDLNNYSLVIPCEDCSATNILKNEGFFNDRGRP